MASQSPLVVGTVKLFIIQARTMDVVLDCLCVGNHSSPMNSWAKYSRKKEKESGTWNYNARPSMI